MRWRLGNGHSNNIWSQPWLQNKDKYYVSSLPLFGLEHLTVHSLIDVESNSWNIEVTDQFFNKEDSQEIKMMPLFNLHDSDILILKVSTMGTYSVWSDYHILMETMVNKEALKVQGSWSTIWNLRIPPKIKHFLWRTLCGCLSTRTRLQTKGVPYSSLCSYCDINLENEWYVFFNCEQVKSVWAVTGNWNKVCSQMQTSESENELIFNMLDTL